MQIDYLELGIYILTCLFLTVLKFFKLSVLQSLFKPNLCSHVILKYARCIKRLPKCREKYQVHNLQSKRIN